MKLSKLFTFAIACLVMLSATVMAHHSTNGIYHDDQTVELTGKIVAWRFINPHPYLTIEVEAEDGSVNEWDISFGGAAVSHLTRKGYRSDTFAPGETIVVKGNPARAEGAYGLLIEREGEDPTREDGSPLF